MAIGHPQVSHPCLGIRRVLGFTICKIELVGHSVSGLSLLWASLELGFPLQSKFSEGGQSQESQGKQCSVPQVALLLYLPAQ